VLAEANPWSAPLSGAYLPEINSASPQARGLVHLFPPAPFGFDRTFKSVGPRGAVFSAQGSPTVKPTAFGPTHYFTTNNYWYIGSPLITAPCSLTGWFYCTEDPLSAYRCLFAFSDANGLRWNLLEIESDGAGGRLDLRMFNGGLANVTSDATVTKNAWNHFGVVFNSGNARIFLNGVGATSVSHTVTTAVTQFSVGAFRYGTNTSDVYNGYIADLRMYSIPLTDQQVLATYLPQTRWDLYERRRSDYSKAFSVAVAKPWLYRRSSTVSRPYLQVA
jgi:hypothetical protein